MDKSDYIEVAKHMMENIQCDNGYHHFEGISYPVKWVNKIAGKAKKFFEANPLHFTDEHIENICGGCEDTVEENGYDQLPYWDELNQVLNEYFDDGMGTGKVEIKPRMMHTYKKNKGSHRLSDKIEHCSPHAPMSEKTIKMINKMADEAYKTK